jgi:hypothetical protein
LTTNRPVLIFDRPCGFGKTTHMIRSFDPDKRYLVVTPLLSECERIAQKAEVPFYQPEISWNDLGHATKLESLTYHLRRQRNVVTTHAMFDNLVDVVKEGLLDSYEIVIDEVMQIFEDNFRVKARTWEQFYLKAGYVTVDPDTRLVSPTSLWEDDIGEVDEALRRNIYTAARAGRLYNVADGINLAVMPEALLKAGRSLTVYTYKAEGSLMYAYLNRLGLNPEHDKGGPEVERRFIRAARERLDLRRIPSLERTDLAFSYTGQTKRSSEELNFLVPKALRSLRNNGLSGVPLQDILITCPKEKWFQDGKNPKESLSQGGLPSSMRGPYARNCGLANSSEQAIWVPNTTRGTNDYNHCSHLIYLYDQYLNPNILKWFGGKQVITHDEYALTELIQLLWRTRIRVPNAGIVTVYIPCRRMRNLLLDWLWEGDVPPEERRKVERLRR